MHAVGFATTVNSARARMPCAGGLPRSPGLPYAKSASLSLPSRDLRRASVERGIELTSLFPAQHVERFDELTHAIDLGAEQPELDDLFIAEVLSEICINFVLIDGLFALFKQVRIMQRRFLTLAKALATRIFEQIVDRVLGQPFRLCDGRAYGRAIATLMRDRNLDAAQLLELVWEYALIEQLVPILDPGDAELAARHQADNARIGRAGTLSRVDQFARVGGLFAFIDVA